VRPLFQYVGQTVQRQISRHDDHRIAHLYGVLAAGDDDGAVPHDGCNQNALLALQFGQWDVRDCRAVGHDKLSRLDLPGDDVIQRFHIAAKRVGGGTGIAFDLVGGDMLGVYG